MQNKFIGVDFSALKRIKVVGEGVRIDAKEFRFDFRENGSLWFWKNGESGESIKLDGNYENPSICLMKSFV